MTVPIRRCAFYTRKSTDEGLEQDFNSLEAQREACESFVKSQRHEGWEALPEEYDDGGFSGGTLNRPALQRLLEACKNGEVDTIVVYKIDRLTRSLADFAKMVELLDTHKVNFVSVTQQFNTTTSMGRLTLNVLLSFAQFEREVTGERIRDKIAASKAKGMWMGGSVPLGYEKDGRTLKIHPEKGELIRRIFNRYLELGSSTLLHRELLRTGQTSMSGKPISIGNLIRILQNPIYIGKIPHHGKTFDGNHPPLVEFPVWQRVQERMSQNIIETRHRIRAKERSLLGNGKLVDVNGYTMTPTHSNKNGKRYRYYQSQGHIQKKPMLPTTVTKIPAGEIEKVVTGHIQRLLVDDEQLQMVIQDLALPLRQRAQTMAAQWHSLPLLQQSQACAAIVKKVKLEMNHLTLSICPSGLHETLGGAAFKSAPVEIVIPIRLKQVANGATIVIHPAGDKPNVPNPHLLGPIARAYQWNQQLINGQVESLNSIARRDVINPRVVRRQLKLAWLTPEVIISITQGQDSVRTLENLSSYT